MSKANLAAIGFKKKEIELNGETYEIREMNAAQLQEYQDSMIDYSDGYKKISTKDAIWLLVLFCLHQDGKPVYDRADKGLIEQLPYSVIDEITDIAQDINGMGKKKESISKN